MTADTRRAATPADWAKALDRAKTAGVIAYTVAGDPRRWFVTSGSAPGTGYLVEVQPGQAPQCQCRAAEHEIPYCLHRAAVLDRLGLLPRAEEPADRPLTLEQHRARMARASADLFGD